MKQQTAVEWLIEQCPRIKTIVAYNILEQAKAMEKEQIKESHFTASGCNSFDIPDDRINSAYKAAQQYYKDIYESYT
jgi:hypothetical protein